MRNLACQTLLHCIERVVSGITGRYVMCSGGTLKAARVDIDNAGELAETKHLAIGDVRDVHLSRQD